MEDSAAGRRWAIEHSHDAVRSFGDCRDWDQKFGHALRRGCLEVNALQESRCQSSKVWRKPNGPFTSKQVCGRSCMHNGMATNGYGECHLWLICMC